MYGTNQFKAEMLDRNVYYHVRPYLDIEWCPHVLMKEKKSFHHAKNVWPTKLQQKCTKSFVTEAYKLSCIYHKRFSVVVEHQPFHTR